MVTYVVVRPELDRVLNSSTGGPDTPCFWTNSDVLVHQYCRPDPLQRAILKTFHKYISDTPTSSKSIRLTKGRNSFRFGKSKNHGSSRASTSTGKTVQVRGHSSAEELERKQAEVFRLLEFYEDAVEKKIPDYLVGLATMVLENVILLSRDVDQMVPNSNSSEIASLIARMNQSMAELVLWNDQFHLYGDDTHNAHSIESIVNNVRQAVKSLVEFAVNKENQNVSNSKLFLGNGSNTSHNENNGPLCSQDSPHTRKKLNGSRNSHIHGSMPDIPLYGNVVYNHSGESSSGDVSLPPSKLTHSLSSDSILDKDGSGSSVQSKHPDDTGESSGDNHHYEFAPPIPPKKIIKQRNALSTPTKELSCPLRQSSPIHSSYSDNIDYPRRSTGSLTPCSTPHSVGKVSPATSHDSVPRNQCLNHSREERTSYGSLNSFETPPVTDLTSMLSQNCDISSVRRNFGSDNSFSSPESSLLHATNVSLVTNSSSSSYSCSVVNSKSFFSQTTQSFSEENRMSSSSDLLRGTSSSSSQLTSHSGSSQHLVIHRSSRSSTCSSSSRSSGSEGESNSISVLVPPPIPEKKRNFSHSSDRATSQYENFSDGGTLSSTDKVDFRQKIPSLGKSELTRVQAMSSISCSTSGLGSSKSSISSDSNNSGSPGANTFIQRRYQETVITENRSIPRRGEKPPLPPKHKHIMEYMQTFKDYQMPDKEWFANRRSQQMISSHHDNSSVSYFGDEFKELEFDNFTPSSRLSLPVSAVMHHLPPALPPKRKSKTSESFRPYMNDQTHVECSSVSNACHTCSCQVAKNSTPALTPSQPMPPNLPLHDVPELQTKEPSKVPFDNTHKSNKSDSGLRLREESESIGIQQYNEPNELSMQKDAAEEEEVCVERTLLDELTVCEDIDFKDGTKESDVKSGTPDALLVYATYSKNGPYLEAFLTTYRTFLNPADVISKLFYRYYKFIISPNPDYQKAAKNAFSLLVRVVHDLVVPELTEELLRDLAEFEYNLLAKGDLKLGLYFRKKLSEKLELRKRHKEQHEFSGHFVSIKDNHQYTLLDFKSSDLADQMTLLDSELFSKVGIPELLHFSRDQNEDRCPNLKVFAMQINNMSSWVETLILRSALQDREKFYKKFIKVMKHLRKVNNNFNSCIAILSGLESAAVCRLDWPKTCTDILKEYRDLFGFERSYRAYRQALAETKPPCIPHLGIILQDLTKLYNVNPNNTNGKVNFLKRWLQFNILEDMKRFIPSKYDIRRNETIINFFNNFEDCMSEEDLWEMSLSIKPQAKPK